ncbi:MAG TPA: His/Gly/Thr/Pro-type tRNA ligase C-terminal domain-containing protein, partial [Methanomicrobiales archaeon]|nr:His/Gly/Thr/Pro-type tRNA ligase C-terminal domain-containing protein [Methanomicrobiales archaeon]
LRALFGGGRYDHLIEQFGSREVPAIGFAFGYSTTRELLKEVGKWPDEALSTDAYVLTVSDSVHEIGLEYAKDLRREGLTVETDLTGRSVGEQFGYADRINAKYTVVVGERDLNEGVVTVQNMDTGEEEQVPKDDVVEQVLDRL